MKTCETCEHYPDCKADPDCGELKVCEFWSSSPAEADPVLLAENERLKEALQSLYDEQNGPPLIRYQKSWEAAMDKAEQALKGGK